MIKFLKWLLKSVFIAFLIIFSINIIGSFININIPLNIWTFLIIMFLRLPGAIILIIFFLL
ncbi:MAG: pro-sigmaK processing inhibitor BofA family protein [Bacilli bacterium]|nr:pro-sigmaK processing inhibitor BofA family protein [Bacilli bacterium]MDD4076596.1 pro-sigmaK processing inhibitor BofA family protein [Bacilli bacterium]MDD4387705.1 pro-sigmaK processing inhibitor BofA family protein [Bacilli bacterium]